jgi:surface protein
MERNFDFELLPNHVIIKIISDLLNTQDETIQSNIANIGSIRIVNYLIQIDNSKVRIVDFMDTCLWLRLLISIGIFDNQPHIKWCDIIKEYLGRIVRERRYTSRVHDLIDISKYESSQRIRDYARCLLYYLITDDSDEVERVFLLGELKDIPVLTNETIESSVKRAIDEKDVSMMKYWDVRKVTYMSGLFSFLTTDIKKLDLTYWDTSNVINMSSLIKFTSINISGITNWNTCRVQYMEELFYIARSFNEPLEWNTKSVTNMRGMFHMATSFNQPLEWDTSKVIDMSSMFRDATSFNQPLDWDTRNVKNMAVMFMSARTFNQALHWDTSNVMNMGYMFKGARSFNQALDWNTKNVTDMSFMFYGTLSFNQALDWDITKVKNRRNMFENSHGRFIS